MTARADFTAEEWSLLRQAPVVAALLVAAADESGTTDELASIAHFYGQTRDHLWDAHANVGFIDELIADGPDLDRSRFGSAQEGINRPAVAEAAPSLLPQAVATLQSKGDAQALDHYRMFTMRLARRVAEAHREGGVLGIGGKPISGSEQAALDEIGRLLGL
jgi:hypothetical protein